MTGGVRAHTRARHEPVSLIRVEYALDFYEAQTFIQRYDSRVLSIIICLKRDMVNPEFSKQPLEVNRDDLFTNSATL